MRSWRTVAISMAAMVLASGCSSTQEGEVEQVAEQLYATVQNEDGAAACELLSQETQKELGDPGDSCEVAVLDAGLTPAGMVEKVSVYDTSGQVRYENDVVFLSEFPDGWKVIGAGCEKQAAAPYDCKVQGG